MKRRIGFTFGGVGLLAMMLLIPETHVAMRDARAQGPPDFVVRIVRQTGPPETITFRGRPSFSVIGGRYFAFVRRPDGIFEDYIPIPAGPGDTLEPVNFELPRPPVDLSRLPRPQPPTMPRTIPADEAPLPQVRPGPPGEDRPSPPPRP
jgi:hypothetical protein